MSQTVHSGYLRDHPTPHHTLQGSSVVLSGIWVVRLLIAKELAKRWYGMQEHWRSFRGHPERRACALQLFGYLLVLETHTNTRYPLLFDNRYVETSCALEKWHAPFFAHFHP